MPRAMPTPMPALAPVLSPESELGVGEDVDVEEISLVVELDCVNEEGMEDSNEDAEDAEENDVLSDADREVELEAKIANFSGAGA